MAGTLYTEIFDLFMLRIKDWRLISLYNNGDGETDFNTYLQGFLILAIPDFDICDQDLEDRDDEAGEFTATLTTRNKVILSLLMTQKWLDKEIRDVNQMNLHLADKDFKMFAEANNLREKTNYRNVLAEEISQTLVAYGFKNVDWTAWNLGNFG